MPFSMRDLFAVALAAVICAPRGAAQMSAGPVQCIDNQRWEQHRWEQLSKAEKSAWATLGWTEVTWNGFYMPVATPAPPTPPPGVMVATPAPSYNWRPDAVTTCFQDLPADRQDAVRQLDYTIESWIACQNSTCGWPPGYGPPPNAPCLDHMNYLQNRYEYNQPWLGLTPAKRQALVRLGWDDQGNMWKNVQIPVSYSLKWNDLVVREREGAEFLGYSREVWEGCEASSPPTPCLVLYRRLEDTMKDWKWDTMPMGIKTRLEELGWDYRSWFEDERPEVYSYAWRNLTVYDMVMGRKSMLPMLNIARLLGYTREVWERCPSAGCQARFDYVKEKYDNIRWDELKKAQQRAWLLLESNAVLWQEKKSPVTMQKRWKELSYEQMAQASYLGHDEGTWQGCQTNWTSGITESGGGISQWIGRTVNAQMTIQRSFSEINGNVYGTEVSTLPVSFIRTFEESVARALFCGNPPYTAIPGPGDPPISDMFVNKVTGEALCVLQNNYEQQRHRIRVVSVVEGSIIVDFQIVKNTTMREDKAPDLLGLLQRQLDNLQSPICNDFYFGKYAKVGVAIEIAPLVVAADFAAEEQLRAAWGEENGCNLAQSARDPAIKCPTAAAHHARPLLLSVFFAAAVALVCSAS